MILVLSGTFDKIEQVFLSTQDESGVVVYTNTELVFILSKTLKVVPATFLLVCF